MIVASLKTLRFLKERMKAYIVGKRHLAGEYADVVYSPDSGETVIARIVLATGLGDDYRKTLLKYLDESGYESVDEWIADVERFHGSLNHVKAYNLRVFLLTRINGPGEIAKRIRDLEYARLSITQGYIDGTMNEQEFLRSTNQISSEIGRLQKLFSLFT